MPKPFGSKTYWTQDNIPAIEKILKECLSKGLKTNEMLAVFREEGFDITSARTVQEWKSKLGLVTKRKEKTDFDNQDLGEVEGEIFIPIGVVGGVDYSPYQISNLGNVLGKKGRKLRWANANGYPLVTLSLDKSAWADADYEPEQAQQFKNNTDFKDTRTQRIKSNAVHRLVAAKFLPKPIPPVFKDIWKTLTKEQKEWIQEIYIVDHINDDKSDPRVENLQWVVPRDNNVHVKKQKNAKKG